MLHYRLVLYAAHLPDTLYIPMSFLVLKQYSQPIEQGKFLTCKCCEMGFALSTDSSTATTCNFPTQITWTTCIKRPHSLQSALISVSLFFHHRKQQCIFCLTSSKWRTALKKSLHTTFIYHSLISHPLHTVLLFHILLSGLSISISLWLLDLNTLWTSTTQSMITSKCSTLVHHPSGTIRQLLHTHKRLITGHYAMNTSYWLRARRCNMLISRF